MTVLRDGSKRSGFTLIELMLVITLLAIILVMAIPGFTSSKKVANEATAISSLRSFTSVQSMYRVRFGLYGNLVDLTTLGFVDDSFSDGEKSGYRYASSGASTAATWAITAEPIDPGISGDRWFYVDESGVIRFRHDGAATSADSALN